MIRATAGLDGPVMTLAASVDGPAVYLDNSAVCDLAEGDSSRRRRFLEIMHCGLELLFSTTKAAELSGPDDKSAEAIRSFLDDIGPRWFPVELSPVDVIQRELQGVASKDVCIAERFLGSYVAELMRRYGQGSGKFICSSDDFLCLGGILDYVGPQRESILKRSAEFDDMLRTKLTTARKKFDHDATWLDRRLPSTPFIPSLRASFVFHNLLRGLVIEDPLIKEGDGMGFCHALMASAFASFATLDKPWKRRIASLPTPNQLARIYCASELDKMVNDMESSCERLLAS